MCSARPLDSTTVSMQSDPTPSVPPKRPSRPVYLVIALIVAWTFGIGGVMSGCGLLQFYREPTTTATEIHEPEQEGLAGYLAQQQQASHDARARALNEHHGRMVPLAAANVLLSALLIIACARALAGKRKANHLALQATIANLLYAVVEFLLSAPVREAVVRATATGPPPEAAGQLDPAQLAAAVAWSFRLITGFQVVTLGLIAYALTRPRVVAFFQPEEDDSINAGS